MLVKKDYFEEFAFPSQQSFDSLKFYLEYNNLNVKLDGNDEVVEINSQPLVTILMTTYNREAFVQQCIESLLGQTYSNLEFIIVDDNSSDNTEQTVKELLKNTTNRLKFIKTSGKRGPGLNKRLGWSHIKGKYVIFLDDDDYFVSKTFIATAIKAFQADSTLSVVAFNSYQEIVEEKKLVVTKSLHPLEKVITSKEVLKDFMINIDKPNSTFPAVFDVEKMVQHQINSMKILNDTQIWLRGFFSGNVLFLGDYVGVYRIHKGSIGYNLDVNYILDNVDEKVRLYCSEGFPIKEEKWLKQQVLINLNHYFVKSSTVKYLAVVKWIYKNFSFITSIQLISTLLNTRARFFVKKMLNN